MDAGLSCRGATKRPLSACSGTHSQRKVADAAAGEVEEEEEEEQEEEEQQQEQEQQEQQEEKEEGRSFLVAINDVREGEGDFSI